MEDKQTETYRKKILEDKKAITDAIARSIKKERKVEFRLFTRLEQEKGKFQLILECWTPKKLRIGGKSRFDKDGCEVVNVPAYSFVVDENQTFKLTFKGNCRKVSSEMFTKGKKESDSEEPNEEDEDEKEEAEDNDFVFLDFVGKKGYSFTIVDMIVLDTERPSGKAIIDKEIRTIEMIEQIVSEPSGICKGKGQVVPVENITCHYEYLTEVEFEVRLPPPPKPVREPTAEEKKLEEFVEETDAEYPSFVPGMDMKTPKSIGVQLNTEEAKILGKNLGLNNDDIEDFMKLPFGAVFMIRKYRGRRPQYSQKVSIKRALEAIDRHDLVPLIMPEETERGTNAVVGNFDNWRNDMNGTTDEDDVFEMNHSLIMHEELPIETDTNTVAKNMDNEKNDTNRMMNDIVVIEKTHTKNEDTCAYVSYSVLYPTSIVALCNCLSMEEAGLLGLQLGLPPSIREVLLESRNPPKELTFRLLQIWNGSKHCHRRVKKIQEALRCVDRDDLADAFGAAFVNRLPFAEKTPSSLSKSIFELSHFDAF